MYVCSIINTGVVNVIIIIMNDFLFVFKIIIVFCYVQNSLFCIPVSHIFKCVGNCIHNAVSYV